MSMNRMIGAAFVAVVQCTICVNCRADDGGKARALQTAVDVALRKDASLAESEEGTGIRSGLASRLREADPKSRDYNQQNWLVGVVGDFVRWDVFLRLRHLPEDAWKIRFAELAWERDYIDRRVASAPEDKRSPGQKATSNIVYHANLAYHEWEWELKQLRLSFQGRIKHAYQDSEDERADYSDEFRAWCRAGIEKAIGRPLTDDDLMFKEDVLRRREERKRRAHDEAVRKPHDGGDVLPHPFSFLGYTFGNMYELSRPFNKSTYGDVILKWFKNFKIEPYFGRSWMRLSLAPRSKIAYLAEMEWSGQNTREELFAFAKDIRADIEKRLGVKLGEFFFEDRSHVCDEATWWKVDWGCARSRSVFGPILIELEAADQPGNRFPSSRCLSLTITDKAAEALVEKERKENPLTFDSKAEEEAERRRFERLKELSRQRKSMKDAQKAKQPQP